IDGRDVWPTLTRGAKSPHDAILLAGTIPSRNAIRMGDWKLLVNPSEQNDEEASAAANNGENQLPAVELYNLAEDVSESKNVAAANPERVKAMRARLNAFLKDAVAPGQRAARQAATR